MEELKKKILQAHQDGDIAALYMLEQQVHDQFNEAMVGDYYTNILDLAHENLTAVLECGRKMSLEEVQDFATLRALYEYAIEYYHAGHFKDASALFEILAGLCDDENFSEAMLLHKAANEQEITLDALLDEYADMPATNAQNTFFINKFNKKAQELLKNQQSKKGETA